MGTEGWVSKPALFRPVKNWLSGFVHRRGVGPMVAGASNNARWNVYPPYTQERDKRTLERVRPVHVGNVYVTWFPLYTLR